MASMTPRHRHEVPKHRAVKAVAISVAAVLVAVLTGGFLVYRHLEGNITPLDVERAIGSERPSEVVPTNQPHKPLNILLLGSDSREGQAARIGGETPGLSDTTILLHLSGNRERAYGVSIPRDLMVDRPDCEGKDGQTIPGRFGMFNEAYAVGGPACTIKTVEQMSNIRINHFVVIKFDGFIDMVNALGGVPVCVPKEVHDNIGHIYLPAGSYEVEGQRALDYVRVRHEISNNGDLGRMRRQQAFLASMANKAISAGTLVNPVRLYNFLDAATKSLITDPELAKLNELVGLAQQFKNIGLSHIQFLTVPIETYPEDPNRVQLTGAAEGLWDRLREDKPLTREQRQNVTTAAQTPSAGPSDHSSHGPSTSPGEPSGSAVPTPSADESARQAAEAAANGLCA